MLAFPTVALLLMSLVSGAVASPREEAAGYRSFLYVSDQRVVTLEVVDSTSAVLNYISLGTSFELLRAPMLLLVDARRTAWRGHVFVDEQAEDLLKRYRVSMLIKPGEFVGYELRGNYRSPVDFTHVYLDIGSRVLEMEGMPDDAFEIAAAQIGELNLDFADRATAIRNAGFVRGFGSLHDSESEKIAEIVSLFPDLAQIAPVLLTNPAPLLPSRFSSLPDPVLVRVRAFVSVAGQVGRLEVDEGINPELDKMAVETIRNSWSFLPAIADSETAPSELVLSVVFRRK